MISNTVTVFGATGSIGIELVRAFLGREWFVLALGRSLSYKQFFAKASADGDSLSVERLCYRRMPDIDRAAICDLIESCGVPRQQPQVYVNATGTCFYAPFLSATRRDFDRMVKDNLEVSFHILSHVCHIAHQVPTMPILYVEIGSRVGANVDHPNFSLYAMVKQGQVGLLRSLAAEMAGTLCGFLVLSPGGVKTRLYDRSLGDRQALRQKFEHNTDLTSPRHVAETVLQDVERWFSSEYRAMASNFECRIV